MRIGGESFEMYCFVEMLLISVFTLFLDEPPIFALAELSFLMIVCITLHPLEVQV